MKTILSNIAKEKGLQVIINVTRPEFGVMSYDVTILKAGEIAKRWDGGYFIGEKDSANSKEAMVADFRKAIDLL